MRTDAPIPRTTPLILTALALLPCLTGCPHRAPAPGAAEDWYRKPGLFAAFDGDARDLSLANAYLLELACYIGDRGTFEVDRTLAAWGFDRRRDFRDPRTSTYGYVASNDRMVLVTFGGTDFLNARDLLSDADALELVDDDRYCVTPGARVHRGFRDSLNTVIDGVVDEVRRQGRAASTQPATQPATVPTPPAATRAAPAGKRLWVAGHSRGGAFAVLAAAAFEKARRDGAGNLPELAGVYTFGQPRVGNGEFVATLGEGGLDVPLYRLINRDDPVANVPPAGLLPQRLSAQRLNDRHGYQHGGVAAHVREDGGVVRQTTEPAGLPDPRTASAGLASHYQPAYQRAIYEALVDPARVREPAWRESVTPERVSAFPEPGQ
jgi:hypothetical protein